uniref:Uncharacterized protein n=1 Tax=Plectus sambesii TaxID=2011161 RepID=A0A914UZU2_9BILA
MKFAIVLLTATLVTVSQGFLATRQERKAFADALEDPKMRALLEDHMITSTKYEEKKTLRDLGVQNYNCPGLMGKSKTVPTNVNSVRPADINVVAALGDSLTAANGAGAQDPIEVILQYRGLAFQIGGDKGLENHVTIPNVLKKYNPQVFGASTGIGTVNVWDVAKLDAGVPGAVSGDLYDQAVDLVAKMQTHQEIDVNNDWKLIGIFIGGNDMCAYCKDGATPAAHSAANFAANIGRAVAYLQQKLPRTIISITGMFQMQMLRQVDSNQMFCQALHLFECGCESDDAFTNQQMQAASQAYQAAQMQLQNNGTFESDTFTLVIQPFLRDVTQPPLTSDGKVDLDFFAPDCFHFSQLGHAVAAKGLWNNIVQAVGSKTTNYDLSNEATALACPDPNCPFIRTTKNSANCAPYQTPGM